MAGLPSDPAPNGSPNDPDDLGTPRWVYLFGVITLLLLGVVILHLSGGGLGGHLPS